MTEHHTTVKTVLDGAAIATTLGTFMQILPAVAAGLSIVWTLMRIIEMISGKPVAELIRRKKRAE